MLVFQTVCVELLQFGAQPADHRGLFVVLGLVPMSPLLLLVVPAVLAFALNGVAIGLWLGPTVARFRDVGPFVASVLQVMMFFTPVFWRVDEISEGSRAALVGWNPFTYLLALFRDPLLGDRAVADRVVRRSRGDRAERRCSRLGSSPGRVPDCRTGCPDGDRLAALGARGVPAALGAGLQPQEPGRAVGPAAESRHPSSSRRCGRWTSTSERAPGSAWSGRTARASRPCSRSWRACCPRPAARCGSRAGCSPCSAAQRRVSTRKRLAATTS